MVTMCQDGLLSLLELFFFLTNCDQCTHTSSEISTILLKGSNVQTFVLIEETVLRGFFNSLDPKFFAAGGAEPLLLMQSGVQRSSESVHWC